MAFSPIPHGTPDWDVPVNATFTDLDARLTSVQDEVDNLTTAGGTYYVSIAASDAPQAVKDSSQYVADGTDDQIPLQSAIDLAAGEGGGIVQLSMGTFTLSAPITLHPRVTLTGVHGDQIFNPDQLVSQSRLALAPSFEGGAAVVLLGQTAGGYANKSAEQRIRHLTIDGSNFTSDTVHGIQGSDYIHGVILEDVAIVRVSGKGVYTFDENGAHPFSWTFRRVLVDNSAGVGYHLVNHTDATLVDAVSIGSGSDGFVLSNMPNSRFIGTRAEWSDGHGYKIEGDWGTGSGSGGMLFSGCSTDRNNFNGFDITSTGNGPILLSGCYTRRDGRNFGSGGGGYAGIYAASAGTPLVISGWSQYPGQDDDGSGVLSPPNGAVFTGNASIQLDTSYVHGIDAAITESGNTIYQEGDSMVYATGDTNAPSRSVPPAPSTGKVPYYLQVAANDAPTAIKDGSDYVCDGTDDDVQIQAAIDAAKAMGGGTVQLTSGTFNLSSGLLITGNTDEDDADSLTLRGAGQQATTLVLATDLNGIELTSWAVANIEDLGIVAAGTGSCITSTAVLSGNEVSFWHSSFRNLRLNGYLGAGSTSGWGMDLSMPWRSVFENIEVEGMANGIRLSNQGDVQNAGDCTFTRMFIEIVGNGHTAIHVSSPSNNMNQNNFNMVEAGANGTGCTGILIDGTSGGASQRFWGLNLEQFQTLINVDNGESNVFDCNYVTCDTGGAGNVGFRCGSNAYNNTFSAKWFNNASGDTVQVIQDNNTTSNTPNIFERIRIENNSGATVTHTRQNNTVYRDITTFNTGNAMPAGLLQYPLTTVNNPSFRADDQGLLSWAFDPAIITGGSGYTLATGKVYLTKLKIVNRSTVVTNILTWITTAGSALTSGQCFAGIYNASGTLLATTADQATAWATTGGKTMALTSPATLAVGNYYVAFLANGTGTLPSIVGSGGNVNLANFGLTAGTARALDSTLNTYTALPSTLTLGSQNQNIAVRWAGLT